MNRIITSTVKSVNIISRSIHSTPSTFFRASTTSLSEIKYAKGPNDDPEIAKKVDKIVEDILSLDILEINQFLEKLQVRGKYPAYEHFTKYGGISSAGPAAAKTEEAPVEEVKVKDSFTLKITEVDASSKIKIIKEVRTITGLGLKEAKELVEKVPSTVKESLTKEDADKFKKILEDVGAKVELV